MIDTQQNEPKLVRRVTLDFIDVPEEQTIRIIEKSAFKGELYLTLEAQDLQTQGADLRLQKCFSSSGNIYVILAQPLFIEEDQPQEQLMALKVLSPDLLVSLAEQEFLQILDDGTKALAKPELAAESDVKLWLGDFPETAI